MSKIKLFMISFAVLTGLAILLTYGLSFAESGDGSDVDEDTYSPTKVKEVRVKQSQLMQSYMNTSADPCENFYEYACGNWEEVNPIPKDKWYYSPWDLLTDKLEVQLREILEEPIGDDEPPNAVDKARIFYRSCTDEETIEKRGAQPLLDFIDDLGGWPAMDEDWNETNFDWIQLAINLSFVEDGVVLAYEVDKSFAGTDYMIYLLQPVLGMTNIDYYLKEEHASKLEAYTELVKRVLILLEVDPQVAQNASEEIVQFEARLADARNSPKKFSAIMYQWNVSKIESDYDTIDWERYFSGVQEADITQEEMVGVDADRAEWYYSKLTEILSDTDLETLANYMIWRGVLFVLPEISGDFRNAWDDFNEILTGQEDPQPLWNRCVEEVNLNMGMAISAPFVKKYFDESSKEVVSNVIDSLKNAFEENLSELDWLGDDTKEYAIKKLRAMKASVGYPEFILSDDAINELHDAIHVVDGEHFENFISITKFHRREDVNKLFKPLNPEFWYFPPTTVNALYGVLLNRIFVFAGILQPPTFYPYFPQSLNYGNMGMPLGHEIIHGFDDRGRTVDLDGNIADWWNESEILTFEEKQKCFEEQYENLSNLDIPFDAAATISENLADNGGVRLAYLAYLKWTKEKLHPKLKVLETLQDLDLDEYQLFFLGYAQTFCEAIRPEAIQENEHEEHSPSKYRIIGSLMNFDKFSEAFQCPEGSPMNPSRKCRIW